MGPSDSGLAAVDQLKYLTKGIERANSWAVDGHKTLNTPYDSGIILCRDGEALSSALHMSAGYIIESPQRDGMFYHSRDVQKSPDY